MTDILYNINEETGQKKDNAWVVAIYQSIQNIPTIVTLLYC